MRIIDLAFVVKAEDGSTAIIEIEDSDVYDAFGEIAEDEHFDLLSDGEILEIAGALEAGQGALVIVWENTWAAKLATAIRDSGGVVVALERRPPGRRAASDRSPGRGRGLDMMRRRVGRPGLLGMAARTAVVAGTATAVSGNVQRRQAGRAAGQGDGGGRAAAAAGRPGRGPGGRAGAGAAAVRSAAAAAPPAEDPMAKLKQLGELHAQGLLTDEEFGAAKAKLLGI